MKFLLSSISIFLLSTVFVFAFTPKAEAIGCEQCRLPNGDGTCKETYYERFVYRAWGRPNKGCLHGRVKFVCTNDCDNTGGRYASMNTCNINGESAVFSCETIRPDGDNVSLPTSGRFAQSSSSEFLFAAFASYQQSAGGVAQCSPKSERLPVSRITL